MILVYQYCYKSLSAATNPHVTLSGPLPSRLVFIFDQAGFLATVVARLYLYIIMNGAVGPISS